MKYLLMLAFVALLSACANPVIEDAHKMASAGQHEGALQLLMQANADDQTDKRVRNAMLQQRETTVAYLVAESEAVRRNGRIEDMQDVLHRLELAAPNHPRVAWLKSEVSRLQRHQRMITEAQQNMDGQRFDKAEVALRAVLTEDPGQARARAMLGRIDELRETQTRRQTTLQLATASKPVTLEFREASIKTVFESLARAADVNFVFDKDVRSDAKVTLFLKNTTVDEAMRVILNTQQLGYKLLNDNTVLVFPATQQKQRDLLDTVTRSFFLVNADPKQAQSLVRTVAKSRDIFVDERLNLLVVRDTPEVIRLVERLIQNIDLADPEVMLELEVMEVSNNQMESLGISWPTTVNYGLANGASTIATRSGLQAYTANPLAVAKLSASKDGTNILANPKIRARNREKARVLLGEKLPVFTTTTTTNGSVSSTVSVSYIDVGLKLDVEPQVQLDNDVTIKVALEVSSITNKVSGPSDSFAYQVGTRQATTTLRLKDGETQILAGLINDNESHSSAGLPGLHDLPVLGRLFGLTTDERKKSEIVLLITPRIIRNVIQPTVAGTPMPSGTESQPGAGSMIMRDGASTSGTSQGGGANAQRTASTGRPGAQAEMVQRVTGPEEVMPGAAFQVAVYNPGKTPLQTSLLMDSATLELDTGDSPGRVLVNVPPGGTQSILLRVKAGIKEGDTTLTLESGGEPWPLRIRYNSSTPGAQPPAEPEQPDEQQPNDQ